MKRAFPVNPVLSTISIRFTNAAFIGVRVMPLVTVPEEKFLYNDFSKTSAFNYIDTEVGRTGRPKTLQWQSEQLESSVRDHALRGELPMSDIEAAARQPGSIDPEAETVEMLADCIKLGHEVRVARQVQNRNNYPADQRIALGADDKFSNPDADLITLISQALDKPLMRPTKMTFGQAAWTSFRSHPQIVKATLKNSGDAGMATRQAVAELFEVEAVEVGPARYNTVKPGQNQQLAYIWGPHLSLLYVNEKANPRNGVSWGYTAQFGTPWAGSMFDKDISAQGGMDIRSGERLRELVVAPQCGYFFENCL